MIHGPLDFFGLLPSGLSVIKGIESSQTGLRRRGESPVTSHRETNATAPVLDSTRDTTYNES